MLAPVVTVGIEPEVLLGVPPGPDRAPEAGTADDLAMCSPASPPPASSSWWRKNLRDVRVVAPAASPHLTPARRELVATAREFAMSEVLPVADELDPRREDILSHLLDRMADLGYFGLLVDPSTGGGVSASSSTDWSPRSWPGRG